MKERVIDIDLERRRMKQFVKKQDKLLFASFHVLLNIAEDVQIERKMVKKKITSYLGQRSAGQTQSCSYSPSRFSKS